MPIRFEWLSKEKKVMRYVVEGDWNWFEYHRVVRISTFQMMNHPHFVHSLIDMRGSTRPKLPAGIAAHARTFGKKGTEALSGFAIVIGLPEETVSEITDYDGTLETADGRVYFAKTDEQVQEFLNQLG
jgi:hypothetical protein